MKVWQAISLVVVLFLTLTSAGKKNKKKVAPEWKPTSMPALNKRFESKPQGQSIKFDCKAVGQPKPNIHWLKDGIRIRNKKNPRMETRKYSLTLSDLAVDMNGNYTCVVKNKHGVLNWTFSLEVQNEAWPLAVEGPKNITQVAGSDVVFTCRVLNDPRATIRWQMIPSDLPMSSTLPVDDFLPDGIDPQVLRLSNVQKKDIGEYRCMAGNIMGLKYSSAWLNVIEPVILPNFPTEPSGGSNNNKETNDNNNNDNNDNNNNDNNNNGFDSFWPYNNNNNNPDQINPNNRDKFKFDEDRFFFTTTRRPKKNGGRRKNGKRKNKKKKNRTPKPFLPETTSLSSTFFTTLEPNGSSSITEDRFLPTTSPTIWRYNNEPTFEGIPDNRYKPNVNDYNGNNDESGEEGTIGSSQGGDDKDEGVNGNISAWKIYTIVGAVGGIILLTGLVAITIAICCPKQEGGGYKSTPV